MNPTRIRYTSAQRPALSAENKARTLAEFAAKTGGTLTTVTNLTFRQTSGDR